MRVAEMIHPHANLIIFSQMWRNSGKDFRGMEYPDESFRLARGAN